MLISDFSDFNSEARLTMVFATSSDGAFEFESFVPTWSIKWFGSLELKVLCNQAYIEWLLQWKIVFSENSIRFILKIWFVFCVFFSCWCNDCVSYGQCYILRCWYVVNWRDLILVDIIMMCLYRASLNNSWTISCSSGRGNSFFNIFSNFSSNVYITLSFLSNWFF